MRRSLERWATTVLAATVGLVACACAGGGSGPANATPTPEPTEQPTPAGTPTATPAPFVSIPEVTPTRPPCGVCGHPVIEYTPTARATSTPDVRPLATLPEQIIVNLDSSLSDAETRYFVRSAADIIGEAQAELGRTAPKFALVAYASQPAIAAKRAAWEGVTPQSLGQQFECDMCAETVYGAVFLRLGPGWFDDAAFPRQVGRATMAHEIFHVFQLEALGKAKADEATHTPPTEVRVNGPAWLGEGSAQWWGFRSTAAQLGVALESVVVSQRDIMKGDTTPLGKMESPSGFRSSTTPYATALVAVDVLMKEREVSSIIEFYQAIGAGQAWQTAFAASFGVTPAEFYEKFAAYRGAQ